MQNHLHPELRVSPLLAVLALWCSTALSQTYSEQENVLHALELSYGKSADERHPRFTIKPEYALVPTFSEDGLLTAISIAPTSSRDPSRVVALSRAEFDSLVATLASIKPLGTFEEGPGGKFVSGWRAHGTQRYQNAFIETAELMGQEEPSPIESASIYYLHPVTGVAKLDRGLSPEAFASFGLLCVNGAHYITPKSEYSKLWSKPNEKQVVELAGPTDDACSPDEALLKRGIAAIEQDRFDIARLTLETLVNTYPDSEYAAKAKLLLSDPKMAK